MEVTVRKAFQSHIFQLSIGRWERSNENTEVRCSRVKSRIYIVAKKIFFITKIHVVKEQNDVLDNNKQSVIFELNKPLDNWSSSS